ncbi:MAG: hypothetical protein U0228_15180 [Myxococcaceae bacterium]
MRTRTCELWTEDEFVFGRFLPNAEVTAVDAHENLAATRELARGRRMKVVVDLREVRSQSADARAVLAGPEATAVSLAVALVVGSPLSRVLGNFYLGFNRPEVPTRLFSSPDDARAWLRSVPE